jgi:hypothetical protein
VPHDGVAALAAPALTTAPVPTPPTRVSVAAAAKTFFLIDMDGPFLGTTAVPCARLPSYHHAMPADSGRLAHFYGDKNGV